ncbi:hypothetical protein HanIR_Chr04g0168551 [Helianthus annuus]|nr:hypothetical protein HanIR_Chr04g0168551 [Helianthus annuus]
MIWEARDAQTGAETSKRTKSGRRCCRGGVPDAGSSVTDAGLQLADALSCCLRDSRRQQPRFFDPEPRNLIPKPH